MKPVKTWKTVLLALLTVLVLLRVAGIFFRGEVDKEYLAMPVYDLAELEYVLCEDAELRFVPSHVCLDSLELSARSPSETAQKLMLSLYRGDLLLYRTSVPVLAEQSDTRNRIAVNLQLKPGEEYRLTLNAEDGEQMLLPIARETEAYETGASYIDHTDARGTLAVSFGYRLAPSLLDRLVISSIWLLFYAGLVILIRHSDIIQERLKAVTGHLKGETGDFLWVCCTELLCCAVIVECSGIPFRPLTKILMVLISLLVSFDSRKKRNCLAGITDTQGKQIGYFLLCLYAAFAFIGQRLFVYPLNLRVSPEALFILLCTLAWAERIVCSLFFCAERMISADHGSVGRKSNCGKLILLLLLILLLPAVYNLIANNPGISDVDTYESFEKYAQNPYGMYNWHPLFYSLLLRQIQKVWNSTYAVILVQYIFWAYVMIELLLYLRKKGMRDSGLIVLALLFGTGAANVLHLNTIWKDVPYATAMIWLLLITAKLSVDQEVYRRKWFIYLELSAAALLVGMLRKNGLVPLIVTALPLLVVFRRNWKLFASLLLTVLMMLYIKGPLYARYEPVEPGRRGIYIGLGQDILGAYYAGGEVSEDTARMIAVMTKYDTAEYDYNPTWAHQEYDLDVEPMTFIRCYLDTFLKNPVLMTRAVIARQDCLWDVFEGEDAVVQNTNFTDTEDGDRRWNEFYSTRVFRSIYPGMSALTAHTVEAQWLNTLVWRCGLLTLLGMTALAFMTLRFGLRAYLLMAAPLTGQILSLLLSTGWTDFRYYWPMNLLNLAMLALLLVAGRDMRKRQKAAKTACAVSGAPGGR